MLVLVFSFNWLSLLQDDLLLHVRDKGTSRAVAQGISKIGQTHRQQSEPVHIRLPRAGHHLHGIDPENWTSWTASLKISVFCPWSDYTRGEYIDTRACFSHIDELLLV